MQFKNKELNAYTIDELTAIDWELAGQEFKFNEAAKHPKFATGKLKPMPINPTFTLLREAVKKEIEVKTNG